MNYDFETSFDCNSTISIERLRKIIRKRRDEFQATRDQMACACGLRIHTYHRMEESRKNFSPEEITALSIGLQLDRDWLCKQAGY